jgi:predicted pyridoxine 5'-phosphate oxidase superfamily flavin-nucleotide-binding protein
MKGPFHAGELEMQRLAGEQTVGARNGEMISNRIMGGALPFLRQQTWAIFGSQGADKRLWCSAVFGSPGFLSSASGYSLAIDRTMVANHPGDPLWQNLHQDAAAGVLAIDLGSRRRLRVNGTVSQCTPERILISVAQAYPNCPKYITRRAIKVSKKQEDSIEPAAQGVQLSAAQQALVRRTDTLFLATAHPTAGIDASHRGGPAGFVKPIDESTLRIPDYAGNSMFNSLGNLIVDPHIGLALLDFERDLCLQITGSGQVRFDVEDPAQLTGGTCRLVEISIEQWIELPLPVRLTTEFLGYSPFNPQPGI